MGIFSLIGLALYFAPSLAGLLLQRQGAVKPGRSLVPIVLVNLLLGWTVIGWFVAWFLVVRATWDAGSAPAARWTPPTPGPGRYAPPSGLREVERWCYGCGGTGQTTCSGCSGRGTVQPGFSTVNAPAWTPCPDCGGRGRIGHRECEGTGRIKSLERA